MKLKYNVKIQRIADSIVAILDDDISLKPRILNLNEQGEDILNFIIEGLETSDIVKRMQDIYAADPKIIENDTLTFISQLKESGIVK